MLWLRRSRSGVSDEVLINAYSDHVSDLLGRIIGLAKQERQNQREHHSFQSSSMADIAYLANYLVGLNGGWEQIARDHFRDGGRDGHADRGRIKRMWKTGRAEWPRDTPMEEQIRLAVEDAGRRRRWIRWR